jgi:hypothetical protein
MVGMSENGPIPDPDKLVSAEAGWLFFVTWSGKMLTEKNSKEKLVRVFNHPYVLNLDDLPVLKDHPFKPAGKAVKLAFTAPPGNVAIGGSRRIPVTVAVQDGEGRTVRGGSFEVALALKAVEGSGRLSGTLTAPTMNGVATFADLTLDKTGRYALSATAPGLRDAISAPFEVGPGAGLLFEQWTRLSRMPDAKLAVPTNPPASREILATAFEIPVRSVTNYAGRLRGQLLPPATGSYVFWLASLAHSELWLGTDSTPVSKVKIAAVDSDTPYCKWPHVNEAKSAPVRLEAGKRYYVEVLQTQKSGSAQLAVRWRQPDGVEERPIPGFRFSPPEARASEARTAKRAN